jgi:hypothetical protein
MIGETHPHCQLLYEVATTAEGEAIYTTRLALALESTVRLPSPRNNKYRQIRNAPLSGTSGSEVVRAESPLA